MQQPFQLVAVSKSLVAKTVVRMEKLVAKTVVATVKTT